MYKHTYTVAVLALAKALTGSKVLNTAEVLVWKD